MSGLASSTSSTSFNCTSLPVSPYLVSTICTSLSLTAAAKPLLPASTQPAPGGPGNQATITTPLPLGNSLARYSPVLAPISPNETRDFADRSGDDMPLITSMTGMPLPLISETTLFRPSKEMAPITTACAPAATQSSICEICLLRLV